MGRRPSIGKHKKSRRNRSKKYRGGMMRGVTPPTTPPRGFNMVQLPPPQTPPGQKPVGPSNISPTDKKEDENVYVPIALFQDD